MATRWVPAGGMQTWPAADPSAEPGPDLDGGLDVDVVEEQSDGWTRVRCANGWEAWVDGRLLLQAPAAPATPAVPMSRNPRVLAGIAAVALVVAFVATRDGGDGGSPGRPSTSSDSLGTTLMTVSDDDVAAAISAAQAPGAADQPAQPDRRASAAVGAAMKAAGYDLGPSVQVVPLAPGSAVLYFKIAADSPLNDLEDDKAKGLLTALLDGPAIRDAGVTRLMISAAASDDQGPYTLLITGTVDDLRAGFVNGDQEAAKRVEIAVKR